MALREAYFRYAVHDDDEAFGREKFAREVYDIYQAEHDSPVYGDIERGRAALPGFDLLKYQAFRDFLNDPFYPEDLRRRLLGRMEVERPDVIETLKKQYDILVEKAKQASEGDL